MSYKREALSRLTTPPPPAVVGALEALEVSITEIESQRYRADREQEHIAKALQVATDQLSKSKQQGRTEAAAERDKELAQLESELRERANIPSKRVDELDGAYATRLQRRQIEETRSLSALVQALVYVQTINMTNDPALIESAVDEVLGMQAAPQTVGPIARAAQTKLQAMAAEEFRNNNGQPGPAFQAQTLVADKLRTWRAGIARESVEARREAILSRYTQRVMNMDVAINGAAHLYGLDELLKRAEIKASIPTEETEK
jgi:hypothetical protein